MTDQRTDLPRRGDWVGDEQPDSEVGEQPVHSPEEIERELRLRPELPQVVRLSRKTLAIGGGIAATALAAMLLWSLRPAGDSTRPEEVYTTDNRLPAEQIAQLPRDYAGLRRDIPQLGPPLPGDLGRPMLNAGVEPQPGDTVPGLAPSAQTVQPNLAAHRRDEERQRRAQELDAARTSKLFAPDAQDGRSGTIPPASSVAAANGSEAGTGGSDALSTATPSQVQPVASPYVLQAGSIIPAALVTGLSSDVPGQVVAQVTQNVRDSVTGRHLLVPQGSRLIGEYDADIAAGQSRALLVWTRLILPDGRSVALERQPAADASGRAGLKDRVDRHWGELFRAAAVSTLLGVGTELVSGNAEDRLVRALRRGAQDAVSDAGQQLVRRSLDIRPTLTVRPGTPVRVILTRDLVLEPPGR